MSKKSKPKAEPKLKKFQVSFSKQIEVKYGPYDIEAENEEDAKSQAVDEAGHDDRARRDADWEDPDLEDIAVVECKEKHSVLTIELNQDISDLLPGLHTTALQRAIQLALMPGAKAKDYKNELRRFKEAFDADRFKWSLREVEEEPSEEAA